MKGFNFLHSALLIGLVSVVAISNTHASNSLQMDLTANQVIKSAEGKTSYVPVRNAPAGTVIQYKAIYSNTINKDIQDLAVVLLIPANMTFTGEASPASAQASIDGKNYADIPLMRKADNKMVKVPFSEYRTLRWHIKLLPAQKSVTVALNTIVN